MGKLEGKIGLVTGGTSGIGLATAKRFVDEGAYVFITGRREPELTKAVKEIGRSVTGVQSDASKLDDLDPPLCTGQAREKQAGCCIRKRRYCEVCPAWYDHRGLLRLDFQHQCERSCLYSAESTASGRMARRSF